MHINDIVTQPHACSCFAVPWWHVQASWSFYFKGGQRNDEAVCFGVAWKPVANISYESNHNRMMYRCWNGELLGQGRIDATKTKVCVCRCLVALIHPSIHLSIHLLAGSEPTEPLLGCRCILETPFAATWTWMHALCRSRSTMCRKACASATLGSRTCTLRAASTTRPPSVPPL